LFFCDLFYFFKKKNKPPVFQFKSNLNAVQLVNNGDWGVLSKLLALAGSTAPMTATAAPVVAPVAVAITSPPLVQVAISVPVVAVASPSAAPAVGVSAAVVASAKRARVGGSPGGNGSSTFLYMTIDKLKKRVTEIGKDLSTRLGANVGFEVDFNTLIKDSTFTKESEADQKGILTGPAADSWANALYGAVNGSSTIEAALRAQPGITKIKWQYAASTVPTAGWAFLEVSGAGTELLIKCAVANADETYGAIVAAGAAAPSAQAAIPVQVAAPVVFTPLAAAVPVVQTPPPVVYHQPIAAPIMIQPVAIAPVSPSPVATPPPAQPVGPVPGTRLALVGGNPGGNGTTGFLYTSLEKFKKLVTDNYKKEFDKAIASTRVTIAIDNSFAKNPVWIKHSEADQKAIVNGPMADNMAQILFKSSSGDHFAGLFRDPKFMERCIKINKISISYAADVTSSEGFNGCELIWVDGGTEIQFRIDITSADYWHEPVGWAISKKAHEGIFGIEKRAAEAAKALEERKAMAAIEAKAAANAQDNEKRLAEEKKAAAQLADQERIRKEHEAGIQERIKTLEESGVTPRMKENNERLKKFLEMVSVSGDIEYDVDNLFIHDRKLRWRDCGTQKTTLKSISIEPWSLFNVLTDASISILESGDVGQKRLLDTYSKFNLQFEGGEVKDKVPRLVWDSGSKTLNIFATFSNMYDPRKWIEDLLQGANTKHIYKGTTITEIFKAMLANAGGWMEEMARDESTTMINDLLAPYWKTHFEGRVVPIEVDWKSLDGQNAKEPLIIRMKKHYQFPPSVLEVLFKSFGSSNLIVMNILRKKLMKIRVVASGSDGIVLENGGETMVVTYKWADQAYSEKQWKAAVEEQVRAKCSGLAVKNVSAEIAMNEASPAVIEMNRTLVAKLGMISANGGYDVLVVDYPSFVDTLEFNKAYGASKFGVLHQSNLHALQSLIRGFEEVSRTALGGPLLKTVKSIKVTLDVKCKDNSDDAPLLWDPVSKTFTVTHSFHSFEHPAGYNYTPRIEYTMGILIESCRLETKKQVDKFYSTVRADFGLNSLPVLIDESYQETKAFTDIHPSKMKAIVMRMFTTLPPSIFHGDMGLKHCSEFPKARQIMHDKVKSIRILPDGLLASNTHKIELEKQELLIRVAFDSSDWTTPIGYRLSTMIASRPMIEQEVMAEVDAALLGFTELLRTKSKNSKIVIKFAWQELLADPTFQAAQNYVNSYVRFMVEKVKIIFEGTKSIYDAGLTHYLQDESLGSHMGDLKEVVFHVSTRNMIGTQGKFGLFTPYYYEVTKGNGDLHIKFNYAKYPVGAGSIVEWVCNPAGAKKREQHHITVISERNHNEEVQRRNDEVAWTISSNENAQARYVRDVDDYNHDMQVFASTPNTENCSSCSGKGYWGRGNRCSSCSGRGFCDVRKTAPTLPITPVPRPIPTFPPTCVADFTHGLHRGELRTGHYVEGSDDFAEKKVSNAKKGRAMIDLDD
jgi:predicted  nucleic acid-binding Zn-ribbon protein